MTPIFLRELRENTKWAAMISLAFCALIFLRAYHASPFYLLELPDPMTLLYAPFAGLAMGFAQSAFETKPDTWAFVVHRPVPRAGIFAAKCAAGILLLYAALALPCLLAVLWASHPGNLPMPFQARTVLPLVADVLTSGGYYFVGILLTLRKARWLGTRLLPAGLAFACSVAVRLTPEFWQALLFIAAAMCIGAVAAWDAFSSAGTSDRPGLPRVALGAMIYCGALTLGFLSNGILAIFETTETWHDVRMTPQGRVVRTTKIFRDDDLTYSVADLDGRPLPEFDGVNLDDPNEADRFVRFTDILEDDRRLPWPMSTMVGGGYRSARAGVRTLRTFGRPGARLATTPLFDVHQRIIDLYDPVTCLLLGRMGPTDFTPGDADPAERFPAEPLGAMTQSGTRTLAFPSAVYWMELDQRRIRKFFVPAEGDPVIAAHELPPAENPTLLIATATRFHLLDGSGKELSSFPMDVDRLHCQVRVARLSANHHLVLRSQALSPNLESQFPPQFLEYDADGKLLRKTLAPEIDDPNPLTEARTAAFALFYPIAGLPLHQPWLIDNVFQLDSQDYPRLFYASVITGSLLAAGLTLLLSRRYGFGPRQRLTWTALTLLTGPAGVVVLAGLHEYPARESCPACRAKRFLARRECPACRATPAPTPADGREIFEPVDAFAVIA